jgi:4-amino-4-deoxy-L-arabinose transferase-like glycosyltransferase
MDPVPWHNCRVTPPAKLLRTSLRLSHPLLALLLITLIRGVLYSFISPPWQGPDEPTHYHYLVALYIDGRAFPAGIPVMPDLYTAIWENATDYRIWDLNQWTDRSVIQPLSPDQTMLTRAGGLYYRLLFPVYALTTGWPLEAQLFAVRVGSASLMMITVAAAYGIARTVYQSDTAHDRMIAWVAAAAVAFQPMYAFISASLNDDNLVAPLTALATLGVVRGLRSEQRPGRGGWWWALAVLSAASAVLTKRTGFAAVGVLVVGALALAVLWIRRGSRWQKTLGWLVSLGFAALCVSLLAVFLAQPLLPAELTWRLQLPERFLLDLADSIEHSATRHWTDWYVQFLFLTLSFWGWFGWLKAPLGLLTISVLRYLSVIITLGVLVRLAFWAVAHRSRENRWRFGLTVVLLLAAVGNATLLLAQHLANSETYMLVGRYLFPSLAAWGVLTVTGWMAFWPRRWAVAGLSVLVVFWVALDVYAWLFVMIPFFYA